MSKHTRGSMLERRKRQERHRQRCTSAPIRRARNFLSRHPSPPGRGTFASVESAVCSIPGVDKKPRLSEERGFILVIRLGTRRFPAPRELVPVVRETCRWCVPLGVACRVETGRRVRRERVMLDDDAGEDLDRIAELFGITRREATPVTVAMNDGAKP